jgi:hypothetical protein
MISTTRKLANAARAGVVLAFLVLAPRAQADLLPMTVTMQLLNSPGQPNTYQFLVDGTTIFNTFCDDAAHPISSIPYTATETDFSDLTGTLLDRQGDPNALLDYERIAILDLQALADPSIVGDVVIASWAITQNRRTRAGTVGAQNLIDWVWTQNPANYDLSGFVIFATTTDQEQTGFVPEPSSWILCGTAVVCFLYLIRRGSPRTRIILRRN